MEINQNRGPRTWESRKDNFGEVFERGTCQCFYELYWPQIQGTSFYSFFHYYKHVILFKILQLLSLFRLFYYCLSFN